MRAISRVTAAVIFSGAAASKITLPLCMKVRMWVAPAAAKMAASSFMGSLALPPTLMPRKSARWVMAIGKLISVLSTTEADN